MEITPFSSQTHNGTSPQMTLLVDYKPRSRRRVILDQWSAKNKDISQKTPDALQNLEKTQKQRGEASAGPPHSGSLPFSPDC